MGYSPDWQKQSYAKGNSTPKVTQKGNIISRPLFDHQPSRLSLADGGDVTEEQLKQEGLAASNAEREAKMADMKPMERIKEGAMSLWERLKAGNIDQKGSEAYNKYGAGRGQMERDMKTPTNNESSDYSGRGTKMPSMDSAPKEESKKPEGVFSKPNITKTGLGGESEVEVKPYKPEPMPQPKALKEEQGPVRPRQKVKRDNSVAKPMKPSVSTGDSEAQEAGTRYANAYRALQNAPAGTSPAARAALEKYVEDAKQEYERKAKRQ